MRRVDVVGGVLCALGLAGPVFALIEEPCRGWGDPVVVVTLRRRAAAARRLRLAGSGAPETRCCPLGLFRRRAFTVGNVYTFATYAALGLVIFFLTLFLQGVAGYARSRPGWPPRR